MPDLFRTFGYSACLSIGMFAGTATATSKDFVLPSDEDVTRVEISTYRLKDDAGTGSTHKTTPPPVEEVYDLYKREFTDSSLIVPILAALRRESGRWRSNWHTVPGYWSRLTIASSKDVAVEIRFDPGTCRNGKDLVSWGGNAKVYAKKLSPETCGALMTALALPERFWKDQ